MTIVRDQIRCLDPKNDAVVSVIVNDRASSTFQSRSAQEWFANAHHVECDVYQNSSDTGCDIYLFLSTVLQRHVVCCHCFNVRSANYRKYGVRTTVDKDA